MTSEMLSTQDSKRRRIMIITADDSIIDEIEKTNNEFLLQQINVPSNQQMKKIKSTNPKSKSLTCVICGSSAYGYNFGAIACESCKAFFRRNAFKNPITFPCRDKNSCKITSETRRNCPSCRLTKCFNNGMQREKLSTIEQKVTKRREIEQNRNLTLQSQLSDDLLTSINTNIHLPDFIDLLSPLTSKSLLSSEDLQRIENISIFYKNRIELASRENLSYNSSIQITTFLQTLNSRSKSIIELLSYFKQIDEFNQLNIDDKIILIKYNLMLILGIYCTLSYNIEPHEIIQSDIDIPTNIQLRQILYGYETFRQTKQIFGSFLRIAEFDEKIIYLLFIIIIFTNGFSITNDYESILYDRIHIYQTQNNYIELLSKYLETIYGFNKTIQVFSQLVFQIISWQKIQEDMRKNILRVLSPQDLNELLPIIKSIFRIS